jgi:hypothetical protein
MFALGASLVLGLVAFFTHSLFTDFSFDALSEVRIQDTQLSLNFRLKLLYTASWAAFPFFVLAVVLLGKFRTRRHVAFISLGTLIAGVIFWFFKIYSLNLRYVEIANVKTPFPMTFYFAREDLNLEIYLLIGFVVGACLSGFALHRYTKRQN